MILVLLLYLINSLSVNCEVDSAIRYLSQSDSGSYRFGYDTGSSLSPQSHQQLNGNNQVRGPYGNAYPNGKPPRIFHYESRGIQTDNSIGSNIRRDITRRQSVWNRPYNLSERTPNIPIYSRDYYKPTNIAISSNQKPIPTRTPILIRKYRESENSRIYYAGRDYGTVPSNIRTDHVESPIPPVNHHFSRQPLSSIPVHRMSINSIRTDSVVGSHTYRSESPSIPLTVVTARPHNRTPAVYSGRGIPSPSAAARLRAQLLRVSDKPGHINRPV